MATGSRSILICDDEAAIRHIVAAKLRAAGYTVYEAPDGQEGQMAAVELLPDLIISDLQMPEIDGLELCTRLREHEATSAIPAILLTARGHLMAEGALEPTNIRAVVSKPFSSKDLLAEVNRAIGGPQREAA